MRLFKLILFLIGFIGLYVNTNLGLPAETAETIPKTMNIISIVTDDQAVWAMGAYGNPEIVLIGKWYLGREIDCYPIHFGLDYYFEIQRGLRP